MMIFACKLYLFRTRHVILTARFQMALLHAQGLSCRSAYVCAYGSVFQFQMTLVYLPLDIEILIFQTTGTQIS